MYFLFGQGQERGAGEKGANHNGARRGDGERGGVAGGGASSEMPPSAKKPTASEEKGRDAVVKRIALHLRGARMLVALAPRLDTPTATATAAAVAAAAANLKAKEAKARQTEAAAAGGVTPPDISASGNSIDDYLNEEQLQDQSPDAEVLPRSWQVMSGAPVYLLRSGGACGAASRGSVWDVDSLHSGRDDSSPSAQRQYSSSHSRRDAPGGWTDEFLYGERGRWRGSDLEGERGGHGAHGSTAGGGAAAGGGDAGAWSFERGHEVIRWREITKQPFDLLLFVDNGPDLGSTRILLTMPEYGSEEQDKARREGKRPGGLYICPTMAEYYLVLSVYFGERSFGSLCRVGLTNHALGVAENFRFAGCQLRREELGHCIDCVWSILGVAGCCWALVAYFGEGKMSWDVACAWSIPLLE